VKNIRTQQTQGFKSKSSDKIAVVNLLSNNLSEQEKIQEFKLLFNGIDFAGWRNVHLTILPDKDGL